MTRKEKVLAFMKSDVYVPLKYDELLACLEVPASDVDELKHLLMELEHNGLIRMTKKNRYLAIKSNDAFVTGNIIITSRGFGFVVPNDLEKGINDIYIASEDVADAMNGDKVMVKLLKAKKINDHHRTGVIIKILERKHSTITGVVREGKKGFVLESDNNRIINKIRIVEAKDARVGDKVVASIVSYSTKTDDKIYVDVEEILGNSEDMLTYIKAILHSYNIKDSFKTEIINEAQAIGEIMPADLEGREDLRNMTIFTIDGEDAKDLDDAVSIKILDNGNYYLGVHIADVSHYVKEGSLLDKEAFMRGTSIYYPAHVVPMLPKELSNGICSLNPKVDRLTFSAFMEIDKSGNVVNYRITTSVINSVERMTYNDVASLIEGRDINLSARYVNILPDINNMNQLASILMNRRNERGSINFEIPEAYITVDKDYKPIDINKRERNIAHKIIEEFMLIANETVAEHAFWAELPFVYRIHETPDATKMADFQKFVYNFGIKLKGRVDEIHPKALQAVLKDVEGEPYELVVSTFMLRSLMKAKYSPQNAGHFGLAAKYYCHFTSPIRRYPDLAIHRILKQQGNIGAKNYDRLKQFAVSASERSSERELVAMQLERDVDDLLKVAYMAGHEGEAFEVVISSVMEFGFFVELENTVEGLVRAETIGDDYYIYNEGDKSLVGRKKGKIYSIGDKVKVRLIKADLSSRRLDFMLEADYMKAVRKRI